MEQKMNSLFTFLSANLFWKKAGEDLEGNKYFYKNLKKNKQKRLILYNKKPDATNIPPEWQSWLTGTIESIPKDFKTYSWQKKHQANQTGTPKAYSPNLNLYNKNSKNKLKIYSSWKPNKLKINND